MRVAVGEAATSPASSSRAIEIAHGRVSVVSCWRQPMTISDKAGYLFPAATVSGRTGALSVLWRLGAVSTSGRVRLTAKAGVPSVRPAVSADVSATASAGTESAWAAVSDVPSALRDASAVLLAS